MCLEYVLFEYTYMCCEICLVLLIWINEFIELSDLIAKAWLTTCFLFVRLAVSLSWMMDIILRSCYDACLRIHRHICRACISTYIIYVYIVCIMYTYILYIYIYTIFYVYTIYN